MNGTSTMKDASVMERHQHKRLNLPQSPQRLLIADDEHLVTAGISANLRELGYAVVGPASDGDEAIEICRIHQPDLALLDIRMPNMSGLDAAKTIFNQMGIPVIILSAYSDPDYVSTANHVGVFGYMLKPVTADELRVNVAIAWGRYLDYLEQDSEIVGLRSRLEDRKVIEQAKWILVKRKDISEPEAMRLLQKHARNNRRPLPEVARSIVENEGVFNSD